MIGVTASDRGHRLRINHTRRPPPSYKKVQEGLKYNYVQLRIKKLSYGLIFVYFGCFNTLKHS